MRAGTTDLRLSPRSGHASCTCPAAYEAGVARAHVVGVLRVCARSRTVSKAHLTAVLKSAAVKLKANEAALRRNRQALLGFPEPTAAAGSDYDPNLRAPRDNPPSATSAGASVAQAAASGGGDPTGMSQLLAPFEGSVPPAAHGEARGTSTAIVPSMATALVQHQLLASPEKVRGRPMPQVAVKRSIAAAGAIVPLDHRCAPNLQYGSVCESVATGQVISKMVQGPCHLVAATKDTQNESQRILVCQHAKHAWEEHVKATKISSANSGDGKPDKLPTGAQVTALSPLAPARAHQTPASLCTYLLFAHLPSSYPCSALACLVPTRLPSCHSCNSRSKPRRRRPMIALCVPLSS